MWRPVFVVLCFCVLLGAEARGGRGRRKWRGPRGSRSNTPSPAPAIVNFEHATEINASVWAEKIESVANFSLMPLYYPLVMFHVSWCQHCKAALPEFEAAAHMVKKAADDGQLKNLPTPVKYFLLQCDLSPAEKEICDKHPGAGYPMIKLFRDRHVVTFTKERWAKTMAQWSIHASRPIILQIEAKKDMEKYQHIGPLFMMSDAAAKEQNVIRQWMDLAFENIEDAYFCVVPDKSEVASLLPAGKSVSVYGKDIEAMPFKGPLKNETKLRQWVNFNRWPIVVETTPEITVRLMQSGYIIVAFAHKFSRFDTKRANAIDKGFKPKASELRKAGKHIFALVDTSSKENANMLSKLFPGVSVPSFFVFTGNISLKHEILYWEDPSLKDANELSFERIEALMADDWARHDNSTASWAKGWTKHTYRFAASGVLGFFIVVCVPLLACGLCVCCVRELMRPDDPEELERQEQIRQQAYKTRPPSKNLRHKRPLTSQDQRALAEINARLQESERQREGLRERLQAKENEENAAKDKAKEAKDDKCQSADDGLKED